MVDNNNDPRNSVGASSTLAWKVSDVARELQCTERHIYKLISEGKIPYAKVGRLVRFSPGKIKEWLSNGGTR